MHHATPRTPQATTTLEGLRRWIHTLALADMGAGALSLAGSSLLGAAQAVNAPVCDFVVSYNAVVDARAEDIQTQMIRFLGAHPDRPQVVVIPYIKEGSTVGAVMCVR